MQILLEDGAECVVRFDGGEDVVAGLIELAGSKVLSAAHFTAIGAAGEVVLSYYDLEKKEYIDTIIKENVEIVGVIGNIAKLNDKFIVHAHGTFSRRDLSVIGGHIKKMVVSATCEVHLTKLNYPLNRAYDERTGLNLLQ